MSREKAELSSQVMENEEDLQDVMRKYKASVAAVSWTRETASRLLSIKSLSSKFGSWRLNWSLRKQREVGWRHS